MCLVFLRITPRSNSSLSRHDLQHYVPPFPVLPHIPCLLPPSRDDNPMPPNPRTARLFGRLATQSPLTHPRFFPLNNLTMLTAPAGDQLLGNRHLSQSTRKQTTLLSTCLADGSFVHSSLRPNTTFLNFAGCMWMMWSSVLWIVGKSRQFFFLEPFADETSTLKITVCHTLEHAQDHSDSVM